MSYRITPVVVTPHNFSTINCSHNSFIRGLQCLVLAAELASNEHQALALRFHEAFGRSLPDSVTPRIVDWLFNAAATGSMTALEDLREHGYHDEAERAIKLLSTRY